MGKILPIKPQIGHATMVLSLYRLMRKILKKYSFKPWGPSAYIFCMVQCLVFYTIAIKLSIFYTIPIFEVMKNNLSFGFYSTCTLVFWLPTLDKFD